MPEKAPGSQTQPASEHEGLAQTIDPRALEVGKQVIGEQGQHLTIEKIDTTKRTWHFFVKDPDTGVTLKITEASMKKLLKAQHEVLSKEKGSKVPPDDTPKPEGTESPSIDEKGSEKKQGKKKVPEKDSTASTPEPEPSALPEQPTPEAPVESTPPTSEPAKESKEKTISWDTIGEKFPHSARVLADLSNPDLSAEDFLRIIAEFNAKRPEPLGGYSLRTKQLSNGRLLIFKWKTGRVRIEGELSRKEAIPESSAPPEPGEKTKIEEAAASAEEPAPEAGTGAAPETPESPKTPEKMLEQVYTGNPDFKEAIETLKNPDLSADDFVSKLTEFNTRTPINRSPQKFKYELPSGRVVIAMWDSEGNVGIGGQLTDDENREAGEPEPVPEAGTAGPEPTAAAEPKEKFPFEIGQLVRIKRSDDTIDEGWEVIGPNNANGETRVVVVKRIKRKHYQLEFPVAELLELNPPSGVTPEPPAPEEKPKPLEISEVLLKALKEARDAYAKDIAHNRKSEATLRAYESIKKEILRELKQNIKDRYVGGEKITSKIFEELLSLTLMNEALEFSFAVRAEKEVMDQRWSKRATRWLRSDSVRKIRLWASWSLLGIGAAGVSSGVGAGVGAAALGLRALIGAAGMAEVVQRFYEISHNERLNQAHKDIAHMGDTEIYSNLAAAMLSEQVSGSLTQKQISAIEKEIAERVTKDRIQTIEKELKEGSTAVGLTIESLFEIIEGELTTVGKELQVEQKKITGREHMVKFVGISAAAALSIAGAGGAFGGAMPDFARTAARVGGGLGGSWLGRTVGRWLGVRLKKSARAELYGGILGAIGGGAAVGVLAPSDGVHAAETTTTHEQAAIPQPSHEQAIPPADTEHGAPTPSTNEAHPSPAPDANAPATPGATPGVQPEAQGATPPVTSETTPGQPEITTPPATVEFNAQAPEGNAENGSITWGGHTLEMKDGIAHNVGVDLSGDGVADKNVDIKIDDFKTGHGTLASDVLNDKGEVVYEKGTVVQVWDKDWNNTASGDAGLVARMNVMKDLDGDGKFETQVGYDKDGTLHWTHQESVQAKWADNLNSADFRTDGNLDNFTKGPDSFGFQGFEITGDTQTEMAHSLAEQWAALHGKASAPAELVTQFNDALTAHPDLYMAHRPDLYPTHSTDRVWSTQDVKSLGVTFEKETQVQPETTQTTETNLQQKYGEYIKGMQHDTWDKEKSVILNFLNQKEPVEFKAVGEGTRAEILNAISGGAKPDVYVGLGSNGVPEKYFIHLSVGGKEYAAVLKPTT